MTRQELVESIKSDLGDRLIEVVERSPARCYVACEPENSIEVN